MANETAIELNAQLFSALASKDAYAAKNAFEALLKREEELFFMALAEAGVIPKEVGMENIYKAGAGIKKIVEIAHQYYSELSTHSPENLKASLLELVEKIPDKDCLPEINDGFFIANTFVRLALNNQNAEGKTVMDALNELMAEVEKENEGEERGGKLKALESVKNRMKNKGAEASAETVRFEEEPGWGTGSDDVRKTAKAAEKKPGEATLPIYGSTIGLEKNNSRGTADNVRHLPIPPRRWP